MSQIEVAEVAIRGKENREGWRVAGVVRYCETTESEGTTVNNA